MIVQSGRIAAVVAVAGLAAACAKPAPPPPAPTPAYEAASLNGSPSQTGGLLRINIATGQTYIAWDNSLTLIPILETPPPSGHYHIYVWSTIMQASGRMSWNAMRMDTISGRIWRLDGDGNTVPFSWGEEAVK